MENGTPIIYIKMDTYQQLNKNYSVGLIKLENLKKIALPLDPNPRTQKVNGRVFKKIKESAESLNLKTPFVFLNRGLTISCQRVKLIDSYNSLYEITFGSGDGLLDGGHTYKAIQESETTNSGLVKIDFLMNLTKEQVVESSEKRNVSDIVTDLTIINSSGNLEFIKKALVHEDYYKFICWRQNEISDKKKSDKKNAFKYFEIKELIPLFTIFNIKAFPNGRTDVSQPTIAYSSIAACTKLFITELEENPDNNVYRQLTPLFKDIIKLYTLINKDFVAIVNSKSIGGKFTQDLHRKSNAISPSGSGKPGSKSIKVSNALIFPILNIFRKYVGFNQNLNTYEWKEDIFKYWNDNKIQIVKETWKLLKDVKRNTQTLGKGSVYWRDLKNTFWD